MPVSSALKSLLCISLVSFAAFAQKPVTGPNINMVSGTKWPNGDPFLTKQNEPSIAVSSVNSQHLLAGANDYRMVDLSQAIDIPGETGAGDAWIFLFTSMDGGGSWRSRAMGGCPQNIPQCNSPLSAAIKGRQFAADPTVRSGPYGTFFLSFIAANRESSANGIVGVQRFLDRNNSVRANEDPIVEDAVNIIDTGTNGQFKDKPWIVADVGGRSFNAGATCTLPGYAAPVPAFHVYVSYSNFVGNSEQNPHPQILVARSRDCGRTFEKAVKVSNSVDTNSGSVLAIDPKTGDLYVIWRRFADVAKGTASAIYFAKSTDGGAKFSNPRVIQEFNAFDQGTTAVSFRTNALPTAIVSVDAQGKSRIHAAWAQRKANGDARIAMSTSSNGGNSWSAATYIDDWTSDPINPANPGRGHQFQPALTFAGGKLMAAWFDQRYDHTVGILECPSGQVCTSIQQFVERRQPVGALASGQVSAVFNEFLADQGLNRRHTIDAFTAMAEPADTPAFQSARASQYLCGNIEAPPKNSKQVRQLRFNVPNVPIFVNNTRSFIGDYLDIGAQTIVATGNVAQPFEFNIARSRRPVFHLTWTDNRDVVPPLKNTASWQHTPGAVFVVNADGSVTTAPNPNCIPGFDGSRNQNIYTAKVGEGLGGFAQVNAKDLSPTRARGFVVGVQNLRETTQAFTLRIPAQPAGGAASFDQATPGVTQVSLNVPPRSSASRVVWVTASSPKASLNVEILDGTGALLNTLALNADPNAAGSFIPNPLADVTSNDLSDPTVKNVELTNVELTNVELTNVELTNVELTNVELTNVELTNVELTNVELTNVELTNVELTNVELTNVELTNVELTNNNFKNVELTNGGLVDTTFTVTNRGNTDTTLNIKTLLRDQKVPDGYKLQLAMRKVSATPSAQMSQEYVNRAAGQCKIAFVEQNVLNANIPEPRIENPGDGTLGQFLTTNPNENNATLPLLAGEKAQITMRILGPSQQEAFQFGQNAVKFVAVGAQGTITPIPLIVQTLSLPAGTALQPYSFTLKSFGGAGNVVWCPAGGGACSLPAWLQLSSTGILSGTPPAAGAYPLTVRVGDTSSVPLQTDVQNLLLTVNPAPQTITFTTPPPLSLAVGQSLILGASAPGGSVVFSATGGCSITGSTLNATEAGICNVTASQGGTTIYAAVSITTSIPVLKATQTISFAPLADRGYGSAAFALTATASSGLPVSYAAAGVCTVAGAIVSLNSTGDCSITASQAGNANYEAAASVTRTFRVTPAALTVTAASQTRVYGTPNAAFSATISGYVNGENAASAGLTGSLVFTTTATTTSDVGIYALIPSGLSSAKYSITYVPGSISVTIATPEFSQLSVSNVAPGTATTPVSGKLSWAGLAPPGNVLIAAGTSSVSAAIQSDGSFAASLPTASLAIGTYTVSFTYAGASPNYAAASAAATLRIEGWQLTGTMRQARTEHTATLLNNGLVLLTGGLDSSGAPTATTELYDPATGSFRTSANLPNKANGHTATLLANGKVFVAGGGNSATEIYDPATEAVDAAGGMSATRRLHTATLLGNGKVLLTGGSDNSNRTLDSTTIYDPATDSFTNGPKMAAARERHVAIRLPNGRVLIAGGRARTGNNYASLRSMEIYDPVANTMNNAASLTSGRHALTALLFADRVLLAGGTNGTADLTTTEWFDPATGVVSAGPALLTARSNFAGVQRGGGLLLSGGKSGTAATASVEEITGSAFAAGPALRVARQGHTMTLLPNGTVFVSGGTGSTGSALNSAELLAPMP